MLLCTSWRVWRSFVDQSAIAAVRARLAISNQTAAANVIKTWRMGTLIPTFARWKSWTQARRERKKLILTKTLDRLSLSATWRAWRQWRLYIEDSNVQSLKDKFTEQYGLLKIQLQHEKLKRAQAMMIRWKMQSILPCFQSWKQYATERKQRKREVLGKTLLRMQNSHVWR